MIFYFEQISVRVLYVIIVRRASMYLLTCRSFKSQEKLGSANRKSTNYKSAHHKKDWDCHLKSKNGHIFGRFRNLIKYVCLKICGFASILPRWTLKVLKLFLFTEGDQGMSTDDMKQHSWWIIVNTVIIQLQRDFTTYAFRYELTASWLVPTQVDLTYINFATVKSCFNRTKANALFLNGALVEKSELVHKISGIQVLNTSYSFSFSFCVDMSVGNVDWDSCWTWLTGQNSNPCYLFTQRSAQGTSCGFEGHWKHASKSSSLGIRGIYGEYIGRWVGPWITLYIPALPMFIQNTFFFWF
jgi:hypothetical protein